MLRTKREQETNCLGKGKEADKEILYLIGSREKLEAESPQKLLSDQGNRD